MHGALQKVLPPWMSEGILEEGYYHVGGAVARAVDLTGFQRPADLVEAWGLVYPGSPFDPDPDHVDVLRFPQHPLMTLTTPKNAPSRPWPTYPLGFLPARQVVPVWTLDRTRVPRDAELWRVERSGEQRRLATFRGPAEGWSGSRGYYPPTHLVGTRAKWRDLDLPAELLDDDRVELVFVGAPPPDGFEQARFEVWRRVVPRDDVAEILDIRITCTYEGVRCRILQHTSQESRLLLLSDDPDVARRLGAEEADIGAFEVTAPNELLTDIAGTAAELEAPAAGQRPPTSNGHRGVGDQTEALNAVLSAVLEEPALVTDSEWDTCAVVADITDEATQLNAYRFVGTGAPAPTPITDQTLFDKFEALRASSTTASGDKWRVCIVKIDRDSGHGVANYVYGDEAALWKITPHTSRQVAENLRPQPADFR